ncbi:MAG TPA: UDP-N-acetylglucosamine 2-epimerase (non-hydrolyzing), partial [Magnetospirillum sp.]|nr:UDP-N-acetylglucosamine 2-epimerase (non-hydrolyzing) [Magnetospirillum sp.]
MNVVGARPNFMKIAPIVDEMKKTPGLEGVLVHTGQHYDPAMSDAFFADFSLPAPDFHLGVGSGSQAEQTGRVMMAYETVATEHRPDWLVVVGDVNSTMACALAAAKLGVPTAHLEAGLRSNDRSMPEEINRIVTDRLADLLWTPSADADENLRAEGVPTNRIDRVGNIMIDAFEMLRPRILARRAAPGFGLSPGCYGVVTLHRPSNVDDRAALSGLVERLAAAARRLPLIFPIHPRTLGRLREWDLLAPLQAAEVIVTQPLGYVDFMSLVSDARFIVTDSGGVQEETTYLGIPCLTMRENTERPVTISHGTNRLVEPARLPNAIDEVMNGRWPTGRRPDLWDGRTAGRVIDSLARHSGILD